MTQESLELFLKKAVTKGGVPFIALRFLKNANGDITGIEGSVTEINEQSEEYVIVIEWNALGTAVATPVQGRYDLVQRVRIVPENTQEDVPLEEN